MNSLTFSPLCSRGARIVSLNEEIDLQRYFEGSILRECL
jgi:hypothetical protein